MNGMFDTDFLTPLKGYYPFRAFGALYRMGEYVSPEYTSAPIYCVAAKNDTSAGILLTNYAEDDSSPAQTVELNLNGIEGREATLYLPDDTHDLEKVEKLTLNGKLTLTLPLFTTYFIKID